MTTAVTTLRYKKSTQSGAFFVVCNADIPSLQIILKATKAFRKDSTTNFLSEGVRLGLAMKLVREVFYWWLRLMRRYCGKQFLILEEQICFIVIKNIVG